MAAGKKRGGRPGSQIPFQMLLYNSFLCDRNIPSCRKFSQQQGKQLKQESPLNQPDSLGPTLPGKAIKLKSLSPRRRVEALTTKLQRLLRAKELPRRSRHQPSCPEEEHSHSGRTLKLAELPEAMQCAPSFPDFLSCHPCWGGPQMQLSLSHLCSCK